MYKIYNTCLYEYIFTYLYFMKYNFNWSFATQNYNASPKPQNNNKNPKCHRREASLQVISQEAPRDLQNKTIQALAFAIGYLAEVEEKTLLLKKNPTHFNNNTWRNQTHLVLEASSLTTLIMLECGMQATKRAQLSIILPSCKDYKLQ